MRTDLLVAILEAHAYVQNARREIDQAEAAVRRAYEAVCNPPAEWAPKPKPVEIKLKSSPEPLSDCHTCYAREGCPVVARPHHGGGHTLEVRHGRD